MLQHVPHCTFSENTVTIFCYFFNQDATLIEGSTNACSHLQRVLNSSEKLDLVIYGSPPPDHSLLDEKHNLWKGISTFKSEHHQNMTRSFIKTTIILLGNQNLGVVSFQLKNEGKNVTHELYTRHSPQIHFQLWLSQTPHTKNGDQGPSVI